MKHKLFLVDDDRKLLETVKSLLEDAGYTVETAASGKEAIERMHRSPYDFSLIIADYGLSDMTGADLVTEILNINRDQYVLILSGSDSAQAVTTPWRAGAAAFIQKNEGVEVFLNTVKKWCKKYDETTRTIGKVADISANEKLIHSLNFIGRSDALAKVAKQILTYRTSTKPVLILGETGTGKELVAKAIHTKGNNSFFPVNCATYKENTNLMESELFGHTAGAFTGATKSTKGIFEMANNGGTVFLDEIHHLSLAGQAKLLRVLQQKTIRPVGENREIPLNFRLVCAAKPELLQMKETGAFLPDLYRRIKVLRIEVPPLRERKEDIELLISHFCERFEKENGTKKTFLMSTVKLMLDYSWPENVGELESTVEELLTNCEGDKVSPQQLDLNFFGDNLSPRFSEVVNKQENLEKQTIESVLRISKSQRKAAEKLGVPESTLRRKMKEYKIVFSPTQKH